MTELSIIIPVYYSENSITALVDKLQIEIAKYISDFEVVLVNDGSKDKSGEHCAALAKKYSKNVLYAELARNFSEHNAVMAGLNDRRIHRHNGRRPAKSRRGSGASFRACA